MKRVFYLFCLLLLAVSVLGQGLGQDGEMPKITVSKMKWSRQTRFSHFPSGDIGIAAEAPPLNSTGTIDRPATQPAPPTEYFVYQADFKNETGRKIIGLAWDYVFFDRENVNELNRYKFRYLHVLKSGKIATLAGNSSLPPTASIGAHAVEKGGARPYTERIDVNCIVFDDRTTWKKATVPEKVCEDLRIELWKRQERMKNLGY